MFEKVSSGDTIFSNLLSKIEIHKKRGKKNYPVQLRQDIIDYIDNSKCTRKIFSDKSGISVATLGRWHREESCCVEPKSHPIPHPIPHVEIKEEAVEDTDKATIKVDGIEIEVPIKHIGRILKQLKE